MTQALRLPGLLALATLIVAPVWAQTASTATQTVDALNTIWGRRSGSAPTRQRCDQRRVRAQREAAALSKAEIFAGKPVPVTARFSDSSGLPTMPGWLARGKPARPLGEVRQGGGTVDVVTNSLAFFPVATGEDFLGVLQASIASPPGGPAPSKSDEFIGAHPALPKAFATASTPTSFATDVYHGVDADASSTRPASGSRSGCNRAGRRVEHISKDDAARMPPDFLVDSAAATPQERPGGVRRHGAARQSRRPDQGPTQPWPADRKMADLGTMTLTKAAVDNAGAARQLRFLPSSLEPGIEVSDDPLIDARVRAYLISFGRRAG